MPIEPITPEEGQESVWDYPRPPRCEPCARHIRIEAGGITLADTTQSYRVLETSHPPVYYLPPADVRIDHLSISAERGSFCEWKGAARYYDLAVNDVLISNAAWSYPSPTPAFAAIKDYLAFYPHKMEACYVDDLQVTPQAGGFYGGWITPDIVGPFKGEPGTMGW